MPTLSPEWAKAASAITIPFRGEPSLPLLADGTAADEPADEPPADEGAPPPERFREMHRLSFVVATIDHDAAVVPRGALVVDASHGIGKNPAYGGLGFEAAGALANYYHFRAPESARAKACLAKPGIVRPSDFLDPCAEDQPAGVWALSYDPSATTAVLRNFYWPGFFFFHVMGTPEYGGVYFGDGLANLDLAFML
jgi:radial spoke head protein 9